MAYCNYERPFPLTEPHLIWMVQKVTCTRVTLSLDVPQPNHSTEKAAHFFVDELIFFAQLVR